MEKFIEKLGEFHRHPPKVYSKKFHLSFSQVTTSFESPSPLRGKARFAPR
jgi:hypothetical protein